MENYATLSIETHLFFARIMKEHALFLEAGFPCKDEKWIKKADWFKEQFENLLGEAVEIAGGRINSDVIESDELVTEFTIPAEKRTECLSGVKIDSEISARTQKLRGVCCRENGRESRELNMRVRELNERAVWLLDGLIEFKERILKEVGKGELFNANYPLLIKHIIREAKLYRSTVEELMQNRRVSYKNLRETEQFWNRIMMEHALFIRGLLDPSEEELIGTADEFAAEYKRLLEMAKRQDCRAMDDMTRKSLEETLRYREFKTAGAEGILNCEIASIILPLLADHVLREANHYIRILESGREI
ncbi:MAG: DUF2935 domain-containing protein [Lachnospiraceae bacterium]|nr:DUF2935 domain-containing protein [Lachnospiraceae bacterium]